MLVVSGSRWDPSGDEVVRFHRLVVVEGLSVRAAGLRLGWSLSTAYRIAHRDSLPLRARSPLTQADRDAIAGLFAQGLMPMDIARAVGLDPSAVYRVGVAVGAWRKPSGNRRAVATTRRVEYLKLRVCGMDRNSAADACGMSRRTALDVDKGVVKGSHRRVVFVPDGEDAHRYKRLMQVLGYVDGRVSVPVQVMPQAAVEKVIDGRYLSVEDREMIADRVNQNMSIRAIARELGRSASTISREIARNSGDDGIYRPFEAHRQSVFRRFRPKPRKIPTNPQLQEVVWAWLRKEYSPEQIAGRLRKDFPGDDTMHVSHETIYQELYFQAKGEMKKVVASAMRSGRTRRKPQGQRIPRSRFIDPMIMISDRPADIEDRAVPGHWEGDLIIGAGGKSAIGTLVERQTRYVMLLHLPHGHDAVAVRDALIETIMTLPEHLRGSLTWDQGAEMAGHRSFSIATDCPVYFCDPGSPWQRGTNENTNGLLRQYFPKGADLNVYGPEDLELVALKLNNRPRKTLDYDTPAERMAELLGLTGT